MPERSSLLADEIRQEIDFLKEETVVTPMWKEQPISEAPSNVYVITAEDIRQSGATDIPTLLRRVPGMSVMELSGGEFAVSARGNNQLFANKILLLIDGRSAYIDAQGVIPWKTLPVSLVEIKQIEVVKGPAAAVYGFNAFDGVVNIITKSPEEMRGATIQAGAGEFATIRSAAVYANRHEQIGYRLSLGHDQNSQWRDRNALALRTSRFNGLINYHPNQDAMIRIEGGVVDTNRMDLASGDFLRVDSPNTISYARVSYERPDFFIRAFWNQQDLTINNGSYPVLAPIFTVSDRFGRTTGIPFLTNSYDVVSQYTAWIFTTHRLSLGANYRYNTLSGTEVFQYGQEHRFGLYVQDEWRPHEKFWVVGGVRMDLQSGINPTYSPRVALFYAPAKDHTFRLSGSVAYRPPTLVEANHEVLTTTTLFGFSSTDVLRGTSQADPEQITSYEAEYQGWYFHHRLRARAAIFHNHISKLITAVDSGPGMAEWRNQPGVADIRGAEVCLEILVASWLRGFATYAYQDINQSFTDIIRRGGPRHAANAGVTADWENGVNLSAVVHYVSSATYPVRAEHSTLANFGIIPASAVPAEQLPSYTLVNLWAGYRFWHRKAEMAVSVYNALNDQHREHPLGDVISSRVMGWLTLRL